MVTDWKGWVLLLVLVVTGYVQDVGWHFQHASGLKRLENLKTYHFLFRGAAWPFFRWGGFIRIACIGIILFLFGWRAAVACGVGAIILSLVVLWRVTKGHALIMLEQVTGIEGLASQAEPLTARVGGMGFSIKRMMFSAPVHFTQLMIYGKKGIDVKSRLVLWKALKQKGLTEQQLKDTFLGALPLQFGDRFTVLANVVTLILGVLFIWLANDSVRDCVLQIHRLTDGPLDYILLAAQWWTFYLVMSAVGSCLTWILVFRAYASRIVKHLGKDHAHA
jgi:hypothetical protein